MSAEAALRALLIADVAVVALIANTGSIAGDSIPLGQPRPFAVYTRLDTEEFRGLDGTLFDTKVQIELQCWGDDRLSADALADACSTAIFAANQGVVGRSTGGDGDLDLEVTTLTVEWWQ
jgi:hypothetical protein